MRHWSFIIFRNKSYSRSRTFNFSGQLSTYTACAADDTRRIYSSNKQLRAALHLSGHLPGRPCATQKDFLHIFPRVISRTRALVLRDSIRAADLEVVQCFFARGLNTHGDSRNRLILTECFRKS